MMRCGDVTSTALGGDRGSVGGMHEGAETRLNRSILGEGGGECGARWGKGAIVVHFQMRSFLVLTSTSPPIKKGRQSGVLDLFGF